MEMMEEREAEQELEEPEVITQVVAVETALEREMGILRIPTLVPTQIVRGIHIIVVGIVTRILLISSLKK